MENARENLALLAGCEPFELVFTSGGTEANNLAILGTPRRDQPAHMIVGALEHHSVTAAANELKRLGWDLQTASCDRDGMIDPDRIADMLRPDSRLVCVQLANPVLGTIQPIREIAEVCHKRGVLLHCDATQAFGKIPVDLPTLDADTLSFSGHKFYGPKGSGALFVRRGLSLNPICFGEPREMGLRPGAENVPACIGLGAAAAIAGRGSNEATSNLIELRDRLANGIISTLSSAPTILGQDAPRLPNTVAVELPINAMEAQRISRQLVVSCPRSDTPPDEMTRVLREVGRSDSQIGKTMSLSVGWTTTRDQIDRAVELLAEACERIG